MESSPESSYLVCYRCGLTVIQESTAAEVSACEDCGREGAKVNMVSMSADPAPPAGRLRRGQRGVTMQHDSDVFASPDPTRLNGRRKKEANTTWLVEFRGAQLSESDRHSLAVRHIAILSPALAAIKRPLDQPLDPRHQSAWVEAPTRGHAVATVVKALSRIGGYDVVTASRAR
jgi:hypothetical protein